MPLLKMLLPTEIQDIHPRPTDTLSVGHKRKGNLILKINFPSKKRSRAKSATKKVSLCSVSETSSSLRSLNEIAALFKTANISSSDYEVLIPSKDQRANKPPEGYMSVYKEQIEAGLRFPLHDLVIEVCNRIVVSPSQFGPTSHRMFVGFILCAQFYKIPVTADYFFSLFRVCSSHSKGLYVSAGSRFLFLTCPPRFHSEWRMEFFFVRPMREAWTCSTKWGESLRSALPDDSLAISAVNLGIMKHYFKCAGLLQKEILVHGGIEQGIPSPGVTLVSLMNKVKSTARGTRKRQKIPSIGPQQALSSPSHTDVPISEDSSTSSEDNVPLNEKSKENQTAILSMPVADDPAQPQALPSHMLAMTEMRESLNVHYQNLETEMQELTSELTFTKSRVEKLEQVLKISESNRVDAENRTSSAKEALKSLTETLHKFKLNSDLNSDKIGNDAICCYGHTSNPLRAP